MRRCAVLRGVPSSGSCRICQCGGVEFDTQVCVVKVEGRVWGVMSGCMLFT